MICIGKQCFFRESGEIRRKKRFNEKTGRSGTAFRQQLAGAVPKKNVSVNRSIIRNYSNGGR